MAVRKRTRLLTNHVGGKWVPSETDEHLDVIDPATGDLLSRVPLSTRPDLDAAVEAARDALPPGGQCLCQTKPGCCSGYASCLLHRSDELARMLTTEMGKTLPDARAEVTRMV